MKNRNYLIYVNISKSEKVFAPAQDPFLIYWSTIPRLLGSKFAFTFSKKQTKGHPSHLSLYCSKKVRDFFLFHPFLFLVYDKRPFSPARRSNVLETINHPYRFLLWPTNRRRRRGKFSLNEHSMAKLSPNLVRICGRVGDRGEMASPVNETSLKWQ